MSFSTVYFFEEGVRTGGIGEHFGYELLAKGFHGSYHLCALDGIIPQAKASSGLQKAGLDHLSIIDAVHHA